jgi:uncharacterized lipoprotein YmbA
MRLALRGAVIWMVAAFVACCAAPPLAVYTLEPPADAADAVSSTGKMKVVEVRRVAVPDALDNQDILVRQGSTLSRSSHGRWASRLSVLVTHYVARQLAQRRPDVLVTDQSQIEAPDYRLFITINALDITAEGTATLEADWLIVPRDPALPSRRQRGRFTATGPVATDQDVVSLNTALLSQLADAIAASSRW